MLRDAIALFVTFGVAGGLLSVLVLPAPLGAWTRLSCSLALAVPATLLASAPGFILHDLAAWNVLLGLGVISLAAGFRLQRARARRTPGGRSARSTWARPSWLHLALIAIACVATWFAVLVPEGVNHIADGHPNGTIVYYHWGIVGKVVDANRIPATLDEWGAPREFPYEYAFSVMHGAATAELAGTADFKLEEGYRLAMVISCLFAAGALWSRWLPAWWAWLAAVLTLNVSRIETRMLVYKPEAFSFVLVLWATWLFDEALERRSATWGGLAGLVLACSFLAHPVGSLLFGPLWLAVLLGRILAPAIRARVHELKEFLRAAFGEVRTLQSAVLPAVLVFLALFLPLRTVIGTTGQDLAQDPTNGVDLTRVVYNLAYISDNPFEHTNVPEAGEPFSVYSTVRPFYSSHARWFYFDTSSLSSVLLIAALGALFVAGLIALLGSDMGGRRLASLRGLITWPTYMLGIFLLTLLVGLAYHTWVPERVGPMRLMPYWGLAFAGMLGAAAWTVAAGMDRLLERRPTIRFLGPRDSWFSEQRAVPVVAVTALALFSFSTGFASRDRGVPPFFNADPRVGGLAPEALSAYGWMHHHLPTNAVVLANGYTEGALGMVSGRTGLLDGRTPFTQPDPWRSDAIRWLRAARAFFLEPLKNPLPARAHYVLASPSTVNLGGSYFPTDFHALEHNPRLQRIHSEGPLVLYRVRAHSTPQSDVAPRQPPG